jgi:hypothetical protein
VHLRPGRGYLQDSPGRCFCSPYLQQRNSPDRVRRYGPDRVMVFLSHARICTCFGNHNPPYLHGCRDRFSCAGMSVELVIWTFAYPPVNSTAQKKTWGGGGGGGSRISIELYCNDQYESGCNTIGRNLANEYVRCWSLPSLKNAELQLSLIEFV